MTSDVNPVTQPPVYYHPDGTLQDSFPLSAKVDPSAVTDDEKAPHEMVMSLFGAVILVSGLLFMRSLPSGQLMGVQSVFLLSYLLLGLWFAIHGFVLQNRVLKHNQMVEAYQTVTYDNQLQEQVVVMKKNDRVGVLMVFWLSVGLGVLQISVLMYRWFDFIQGWLSQ